MSSIPEVDVLLATYNGEKYIEAFLVSLSQQKNCKINLFVSDDGSVDLTIPLALKYKNYFNNFHLMQGPKLGPMQNFFCLLRASSASFVALADQDDIWMENHLEKSVRRIQGANSPCLTFSSVEQFQDGLIQCDIWPKHNHQPEFPNILFENVGRGCTFVMNSHARDLVNKYEPKEAIMHDWWILLRLLLHGTVIFSNIPEIKYRIHDDNFIGIGNRGLKSTINTLKLGKIQTVKQLFELYRESNNEKNHPAIQFDLQSLVESLEGGVLKRKNLVFSRKYTFRRKFFDDLRLRTIILFLPLFNRKP